MKKSTTMRIIFFILSACLFGISCNTADKNATGGSTPVSEYFNYGDSGVQSAGVRMIPIKTPVGNFKVWTKAFR
ncbi:MAG: hypothetical protein V9F01_05300 [Chitinophagaceae bacterium]